MDELNTYDLMVMKAALTKFPFLEKLNELGNLAEDNLGEFCKHLTLEYHPSGKMVFEKGDIGESFYIIFYGKVDILIPEEKVIKFENG